MKRTVKNKHLYRKLVKDEIKVEKIRRALELLKRYEEENDDPAWYEMAKMWSGEEWFEFDIVRGCYHINRKVKVEDIENVIRFIRESGNEL